MEFLKDKKVYLIIAALVFIAALVIYFVAVYRPNKSQSWSANHEKTNGSNSSKSADKTEVLLFYVDWCPHCKTAKPVWTEVAEQYEETVTFREINCTVETAEIEQLMNKYNIEGFPTIKMVKNGKVYDFDAKVSKANLEQFLNTM
jgi:thiol-disulfide isomerase/thioredoxin